MTTSSPSSIWKEDGVAMITVLSFLKKRFHFQEGWGGGRDHSSLTPSGREVTPRGRADAMATTFFFPSLDLGWSGAMVTLLHEGQMPGTQPSLPPLRKAEWVTSITPSLFPSRKKDRHHPRMLPIFSLKVGLSGNDYTLPFLKKRPLPRGAEAMATPSRTPSGQG